MSHRQDADIYSAMTYKVIQRKKMSSIGDCLSPKDIPTGVAFKIQIQNSNRPVLMLKKKITDETNYFFILFRIKIIVYLLSLAFSWA